MKQELNKEVIKKLMKFKGEIRGLEIKSDGQFVLKKQGLEALKKVEEKLKEVGYPIEYEKIKSLDFYPGGIKILSLLAIKDVLNYTNEDIKKLGEFDSQTSLIIRFFIMHFAFASKFFFKQSPKIWRKHWTSGNLIPLNYDEKNKVVIIQIKEFNLHPIYCVYLQGYFSAIFRLLIKSEKATCQETKCSFKGEQLHEFLIK